MGNNMLVIREPQLRVLEIAQAKSFEGRLAAHCRRFFPRAANALGEQLADAVREAFERAKSHGFARERDICKYLNLVFTFGRDFDRSPLTAWAKPLLRSSLPSAEKMDRLYAAGLAREAEGRGYFAPVEEPR
jgi:hypothetical protein